MVRLNLQTIMKAFNEMVLSETKRLLCELPWEQTALGAMDCWPPAMRTVIRTALSSGFPVYTAWGEQAIQIYNDAYIPIFGNKHPRSFGRPAQESWPEIWEFLGPSFDQVKTTGEALWFKNTLLPLAKQGKPEECYFDFSYSPITNAYGEVLGVMSIAMEKTAEVILERRQKVLELTSVEADTTTFQGIAERLRGILAVNEMDAASAVLLSADAQRGLPGSIMWSIRTQPSTVEALRPLLASATQTGRKLQVLDTTGLGFSPPAAQQGCAIPVCGCADKVLAWLVIVPHELVSPNGHLEFAASLSDRLHRVVRYAEAREQELGELKHEMESREELYQFLFDNIGDAVIYAATDGAPHSEEIILDVNLQACQMLGAERHEIVGADKDQFFFPGDVRLAAALQERARTSAFVGELSYRKANGDAVIGEFSSKLVRHRDGACRSVTIVRDVAHRQVREREQAEKVRLETMAQLTGGIAHDFNNLLTVIIGSLEAVMERLPAASAERNVVANAMLASERAACLTNQLLAYSKRQPLNAKPIDLNAFIHEISGLLRSSLGEINVLHLELAEDLPTCTIDTAQLTTSMINLVVNARDAMPDGGQVTVRTQAVTLEGQTHPGGSFLPEGRYIRISIEDTGTGIPEDLQARIFDPFFTTKEVGSGSGLGLSLVQGFIRQSAGDVRITSKAGSGTRVDLLIPAVEGPPGQNADEMASLVAEGQVVLLVEDNDLVRAQTQQMLSQAGFSPIAATDARQALALLAKCPGVEIVLTDLVMPGGMSGLELAQEIKKRRPGLPIVITTGYDLRAMLSEGQAAEFEVLPKPYTRRRLASTLLRLTS